MKSQRARVATENSGTQADGRKIERAAERKRQKQDRDSRIEQFGKSLLHYPQPYPVI